MVTALYLTRLRPCPHCGVGSLVDDGGGDRVCLLCARSPTEPPALARVPKSVRHGPPLRGPRLTVPERRMLREG
jgi:hypothetical protein